MKRLSVLLLGTMLLLPVSAHGETLQEALARAYLGNPTLNAARAQQRATDEQVPQALSGWRPSVTVNGDIVPTTGQLKSFTTNNTSSLDETPASIAITLDQPIFRGFATVESTAAAEATVKAGQQNLLSTEQNVLYNAVQAYMDVYSERQLVQLQAENVKVISAELNAAQARFEVGELTRTDVEQARASLSDAQATFTSQKAQLAAAVADYVRIIGKEPGVLKYPALRGLPRTLNAALAISAETNPSILLAAFVEEAALHNIEVARSALLPQAGFQARLGTVQDLQQNSNSSYTGTIAGVLQVPLYEAGLAYSQVREAKQIASQRRIQVIEAERTVRQTVVAAWNYLIAARQVIVARKDQVAAARFALTGVQQEYEVGTRTTLDVLDAQAAVVAARRSQVEAERVQVLAAYQVLASIGHLTAQNLALRVPYYDPGENYRAVRNKWIGTEANTIE